jgi:regulatory protein
VTAARSAPSRKRSAKPVTAAILNDAALLYVTRYAASSRQLRRVLLRRIARARLAGREIAEGADAIVEQIIARLVRSKVIDDEAFARRRASALARRGESQRRIAQRLSSAGIDADGRRAALAASMDDEGHGDRDAADYAAAIRFARRRKLGPYRLEARQERRQRDLAAMARAGFDLSIARRVIDAADTDEFP